MATINCDHLSDAITVITLDPSLSITLRTLLERSPFTWKTGYSGVNSNGTVPSGEFFSEKKIRPSELLV